MFNGRNRPMNYYVIYFSFFHNEIISFCLENGTILQTSGLHVIQRIKIFLRNTYVGEIETTVIQRDQGLILHMVLTNKKMRVSNFVNVLERKVAYILVQ
jgi:hypothetical protein